MIRATSFLLAGLWPGAPADTVLLDFEARHRRRIVMSAKGGTSFLLDLPTAVALRQGDGILLEDGRIVAVEAAAEPLVDVSAPDPSVLTRVAWHLGDQHIPTQLLGDHLRIRRDGGIETMLRELGATVCPVEAPFDPEGDVLGPGGRDGWQGAAFFSSQGSAPGSSAFADGHDPAFAESHGHAYAGGRSHSNSHSQSATESHSQSPGDRRHDRREPRHGSPGSAGDGQDPGQG